VTRQAERGNATLTPLSHRAVAGGSADPTPCFHASSRLRRSYGAQLCRTSRSRTSSSGTSSATARSSRGRSAFAGAPRYVPSTSGAARPIRPPASTPQAVCRPSASQLTRRERSCASSTKRSQGKRPRLRGSHRQLRRPPAHERGRARPARARSWTTPTPVTTVTWLLRRVSSSAGPDELHRSCHADGAARRVSREAAACGRIHMSGARGAGACFPLIRGPAPDLSRNHSGRAPTHRSCGRAVGSLPQGTRRSHSRRGPQVPRLSDSTGDWQVEPALGPEQSLSVVPGTRPRAS